MPQLDIATYSTQIVWLAITFAALFLVMWRSAVPRISDALEQRQKRLDDNLSKAEELKKEAEAALEAYESSLTDARGQAHSAIAEVHAKLVEETSAQEAELNAKITKMLNDSETQISKATEEAMGSVREIAEEVASSAVERLLGEAIDAKTVAGAVDTAAKARD